MLAWRVCREPFADLSGEGARIYGGRWNSPGRPLVYAAENAALAVLEVRVHLDLPADLLPPDYLLLTLDLGNLAVESLTERVAHARVFGDRWLAERRSPVLSVPSVIVPECSNLLLNPLHPNSASSRVVARRPFSFDERLWPGE